MPDKGQLLREQRHGSKAGTHDLIFLQPPKDRDPGKEAVGGWSDVGLAARGVQLPGRIDDVVSRPEEVEGEEGTERDASHEDALSRAERGPVSSHSDCPGGGRLSCGRDGLGR